MLKIVIFYSLFVENHPGGDKLKFVNKNGLRAYEHELNKVLYAAGYGMRTMWDSMPKPIKFVRNFFAEIDRQLTGEYDDEEPLNAEEKKV